MNQVESLYMGKAGERYFRHRTKRYEVSAQRHSALQFTPYIQSEDTVLDFGCGTGEILSSLPCRRRIGIEVNEPSRAAAEANGVEVHSDFSAVADASIDVVITHHALEHTSQPFAIVSAMLRVLKAGGTLVAVVPCEPGHRRSFRRWHEQADLHLFSWNPLSLGNLVKSCGFTVREGRIATAGFSAYNRWLAGVPLAFSFAEKLSAYALGRFNTVCVATKPGSGR